MLIDEVKKGNENAFCEVVERFSPLIKKYVKLLYKDDGEDVYEELIIALWEAINKLKYYDKEGQVIKYISMVLKNRFIALYRKSKVEHSFVILHKECEITYLDINQSILEYRVDMDNFLKKCCENKRNIYFKILICNDSDTRIASESGVSRQYINRLRKELRNKVRENYMNYVY